MPVQSLLKFVRNRAPRADSVPDGERVYAIGDVHGRADLLDRLLDLIDEDDRGRPRAKSRIILLGDLIDRGPDSRAVVERAIELSSRLPGTRFLMGNHEEVFLRALGGDAAALRLLLRIGGKETILSYGIGADEYWRLDFDELASLLKDKVPDTHIAFLSAFEHSIEVGDYLFVHAGIRPGIEIDQQSPREMHWIRDEFLRHRESFGKIVVHGHSISEEVEIRPNRIGIDTGAYASGRLTAIALEGDRRWFLST